MNTSHKIMGPAILLMRRYSTWHFAILLFVTALIVSIAGCGSKDSPSTESSLPEYNLDVIADNILVPSCCSRVTRDGLAKQQDIEKLKEETPDGMAFIPGGLTKIGSEDGQADERPSFNMHVNSFYLDKNLVTVSDYREFVVETGYVTFSEKEGDGIIFDFNQARWVLADGVDWQYPLGPDNEKAADNHPVTLLTIEDVEAYLKWAGKRLPTEFEWEHAARGISDRENPYAWGTQLVMDGSFMANTWNGVFPNRNTKDDGYLTTSPVGKFGTTELGLTDMGGNVWEWTSSWYRPYSEIEKDYTPGPQSEKVIRGGSFMCHDSYCHGYRVSARSNTPPDNNMFHIGFRGVKDIQ